MIRRLENCFVARLGLWLLTLAVFPVSVTILAHSFRVEVLACNIPATEDHVADVGASLGILQAEEPAASLDLSARVLVRLVEAESRETDAWLRDDYRIARVTVGYARRGSPIPHIEATYRVLGVHPDQVWPRIMARRRAILGASYDDFFGAFSGSEVPATGVVSPRKPAGSVTLAELEQRKKAAA